MMAVKVNVKGFTGVEASIKKTFKAVSENKQMLDEIGKIAVERMKGEARRQTPLQGKKKGSFPAGYPAEATKLYREYIARFNQTHPVYGRGRKNLTITGQLIESLTYKVKDGVIRFFVEGKRRPYRGKNGIIKGQELSNSKIYQHLIDENVKFRFIGIDPKLTKRITNIVKRTMRRALSIQRRLKK